MPSRTETFKIAKSVLENDANKRSISQYDAQAHILWLLRASHGVMNMTDTSQSIRPVIPLSCVNTPLYPWTLSARSIMEIKSLSLGDFFRYNGVIIAMGCQITSLTIVYSIVYSDADQRKHQSSASLAFVRGIHRWPVNSPHKRPVTMTMTMTMTMK